MKSWPEEWALKQIAQLNRTLAHYSALTPAQWADVARLEKARLTLKAFYERVRSKDVAKDN